MVGQSGNTPKAVSRDITFLEIQNYPEKCSRSNEKGTRKGIPHEDAMGDKNYLKKLIANKDANWYPGSHLYIDQGTCSSTLRASFFCFVRALIS